MQLPPQGTGFPNFLDGLGNVFNQALSNYAETLLPERTPQVITPPAVDTTDEERRQSENTTIGLNPYFPSGLASGSTVAYLGFGLAAVIAVALVVKLVK